MNILYLSNLSAKGYVGPTHSVPRQILAQSKYDHVFWYNLSRIDKEKLSTIFPVYTSEDYPSESIHSFPVPFNRPDLIVVEQFYMFKLHKIFREMIRLKIPFIIVPRGEFTAGAQHRKFLKKFICNHLYFYHIAQSATAIQYLTEREAEQSGKQWNSHFLVVPNGIARQAQPIARKKRNHPGVHITYIGRVEIFQKGLDLLVKACSEVSQLIISKQCIIHIYGPDREGSKTTLAKMIHQAGLSANILMHDGVYGEEKKNVLLDSDIFIMTSRSEGHPMAMLEALSYGIPCIASEGTNMAETIHDHAAGWGCGNRVKDISQVLSNILEGDLDLGEMSENARKLADTYDWDILAREAHYKYQEILNKCNLNRQE